MVDKNDALYREVDGELRRDQMAKLWDRYGTYALAVAVLIVVGVFGYKVWEGRQIARAEAGGAQYNEALRLSATGKADEAAKVFESLAATGPGGYAALAELQQAGALLKAGKTQDARVLFEALASKSGTDPLFKNFAEIQAAALRLGTADFTEMQNRLNALAAEDSPWRHSALELLGLAAMKANRIDDASKAYESLLADRATPQGVQERARVMMGTIATAALAKAKESPAAPPAASAPDAGTSAPPATAGAATK